MSTAEVEDEVEPVEDADLIFTRRVASDIGRGPDDTYNAGDVRQLRQAAKTAKAREADRRETLRLIMSHPNGRAWIYWLLGECHILETCFNSNSLRMAMLEGERNVGLKVMSEINQVALDEHVVMMRENAGV